MKVGGYGQMDVWVCAMVTRFYKTSYRLLHCIKFPEAVVKTRVLAWAEGREGPDWGKWSLPCHPWGRNMAQDQS